MQKQNQFIVITLLVLCLWGKSYSGVLQDIGVVLPGVYAGSVAWGDYDNDGYPDLAICGEQKSGNTLERITYVYRNVNGNLALAQRLEGVYFGAVAWADYDNDGDLDLAVSGIDGDNLNTLLLYKFEAGFFELDNNQSELVPVRYSSLDWGDYNRDGYADLVVTGMNVLGEASTIVYKNQRQGLRNLLAPDPVQVLLNVNKGSAEWGDYDGDGDLDLALAGFNSSGFRAAKIFRNNPVGILREDKTNSEAISKLSAARIYWGDLDNNGAVDLLETGWSDGWLPQISLWENSADGILREDIWDSHMHFHAAGAAAWGDYDNDGDMDIAVMGQDENSQVYGYVFRNISYENFQIDNSQTQITGLRNGDVAWVDYDSDGDLDLFMTGETNAGIRMSKLYRNDETSAVMPSPPHEISSIFITNASLSVYWEAGSDVETPQNVLSYNIRIGTQPGTGDIVSAAIPSGSGNAGTRTNFTLNRPLPKDTYYLSVQTIDNQWRKSAFLPDVSFTIDLFVNSTQKLLDLQQSAMAWGDYNNDGYPDVIIGGQDLNGNPRSLLFDNERGTLAENIDLTANLMRFRNGDCGWGDVDNDGDLDLVILGASERNIPLAAFYTNEAGELLTGNVINTAALVPLSFSSLEWGDLDNDGDLDLATIGVDAGGQLRTVLYRDSSGVLFPVGNAGIIGFANGNVRLVDYDNDGDLDIALTGENDGLAGTREGRLYANNGNWNFNASVLNKFPELYAGRMAWADYDNDGDYDLALSGDSPSGQRQFYFYENNPPGRLTLRTQIGQNVTAVQGGSMVWGDYDNDGDVDLIVSGNDANARPVLQAFENNNNTLSPDPQSVFLNKGVDFSSIALVDIDRDGDLDLLTLGRGEQNFVSYSEVFDNIESITNKNYAPYPPALNVPAVSGSSAGLSWSAASDPEGNGTTADGLSYRLRVGSSPAGNEIVSGKYPVGFGRQGFLRQITLYNMPSGTYYWAVQSVDAGYAASQWTGEGQFIIDTIKPQVDTVQVTPAIAGIGNATILINFTENFDLDVSRQPEVTVTVGGVQSTVRQISFDGKAWIGELDVPASLPSGTAAVAIRNVYDRQGNLMDPNPAAGTFSIDTQRPYVTDTEPPVNEAGVSNSIIIKAYFNESLKPETATQEGIKLFRGSTELQGTITYDSEKKTISLTPSDRLTGNTEYQVRIAARISDQVGNTLPEDYIWLFKTAETVSAGSGGEISNQSGTIKLYFSPKSLENDQEVPIQDLEVEPVDPPAGVRFTGIAFILGPEQEIVTLEKPAILSVGFSQVVAGGFNLEKLSIIEENPDQPNEFLWDTPLGGTVDVDAAEISTPISKLGVFGLFEDTRDLAGDGGISQINFSPRVFSPNGSGLLPQDTGLSFRLGNSMTVSIEVFNAAGRFVKRLAESQSMNTGMQTVRWDGKDADGKYCPSGIYIVKIEGDGITEFKTVGVLNK